MKKNGFIATSLIYSFFLIFITLFLTIIADYLQQKVLLNTIERGIKNDINDSLGIQDFEVGDLLNFSWTEPNICRSVIGGSNSACGFDNVKLYEVVTVTYTSDSENICVGEYDNTSGTLASCSKYIMLTGIRLVKQSDSMGSAVTITGVKS